LGIALERIFAYNRFLKLEEGAFMMLQLGLEKGDEAMVSDKTIAAAPITQVVQQLLYHKGQSIHSIETVAEVALSKQRLRLRKYLSTLATIGSTSPFIGLFGTVLGVMAAFAAMGKDGLSGEAMAKGISEALSATALGLLVAIPAVLFYNFLLGRAQALHLTVQGHTVRLLPYIAAAEREKVEA
jgi:biopolymer transport protein ExbB/TolQ